MMIKPKQIADWPHRIIDVRNPDEFASERLPRAECVPLGRLMDSVSDWDRNERLLVICKSGMRARQAIQQLEAAGFTQVCTVEGGLDACKRDGIEVIVDRKRIPLYRQIMIVAGLLLLAGLSLSMVYHPFIAVAWFIGVGLVFGGATGHCPMACLLEKMPWNSDSCCGEKTCS